MKASGFTDAQKKFSLKQGDDGGGGGDLPAGGSQPGDLLQLEEEVCRSVADGDAAVEASREAPKRLVAALSLDMEMHQGSARPWPKAT